MADTQLPARYDGHFNDANQPPQTQSGAPTEHNASKVGSEDKQEGDANKRAAIRRRLKAAKEAANKVLKVAHPRPTTDLGQPLLTHAMLSAEFSPKSVEKQCEGNREKGVGLVDRSRVVVEDALDMAAHPKKKIQQKIKETATARFASTHHPYASKTDEYQYLNEHGKMPPFDSMSSANLENRKSQGEALEDHRDKMRVAWTTARLRRVRVVPWTPKPFPKGETYNETNPVTQVSRFPTLQWIGQILLYLTQNVSPRYTDQFKELPFDLVTTRNHVERLVLNSGGWQAWAMDLRSLYRWDNPRRTARWFLTYSILWYFSLIPAFFWSFIIYAVLTNRFKRRSLRNLQAAVDRALDRESTAFQLGELLDRHGHDEWLDHLVQELGPYVQIQLGDMADLLEVLHNFYSWKSPWKTCWSLCFLASCLACCLFADTQFCMKIIWFTTGASFFCCWPIASIYPQYRLLLSPIKWVFWGIPTDADLSFEYLRRQAQYLREDAIEQKVETVHQSETDNPPLERYSGKLQLQRPAMDVQGDENIDATSEPSDSSEDWQSAISAESILSEEDVISFRCHWEGVAGRLLVRSTGVCFRRSLPQKDMWEMSFQDFEEMWKSGLDGHRKPTLRGLFDSGILAFKDTTGRVHRLDPIKYRDEAFNCIIGFSSLQWQAIATEPDRGRNNLKQSS